MGKCSRLSGRAGELGLCLPRSGDGWMGWEQLGDRELLLYRVRVEEGLVGGW